MEERGKSILFPTILASCTDPSSGSSDKDPQLPCQESRGGTDCSPRLIMNDEWPSKKSGSGYESEQNLDVLRPFWGNIQDSGPAVAWKPQQRQERDESLAPEEIPQRPDRPRGGGEGAAGSLQASLWE